MDRTGFTASLLELGGRRNIEYIEKNGRYIFAKDYPELKDIRSEHMQREFLFEKWEEKYKNI